MTQNQQTPQTLNGFDLDAMRGTLDAISSEPLVAKFQFRATNSWLGGGHNRTTVTDFDGACQKHVHEKPHVLDNDEPPVLLGTDKAANPAVVALHALAGCLCSALVLHAAARGIEVRSVESTLEGDIDLQGLLGMDPSVRNGFEGVRVGIKVDADASSELIDELVEIAAAR